jgi:hypothetical protein
MMWRWDPHVREEKKKKKIKETPDVVVHVRVRAWLAHLSSFAGAPLSFFFFTSFLLCFIF